MHQTQKNRAEQPARFFFERCGIAIFVKTPGVSPLKTRLAATHGAAYALAWYARAAAAVRQVALESGASVYWAVAETAALDAPQWQDLPRIAQCAGDQPDATQDLGARMHNVHTQLLARHHAGILLGADLPHLRTEVLQDAVAWLCAESSAGQAVPRHALAPALDGGFWLYGSNQRSTVAPWQSVQYSQSDTATQFRAAMLHSAADWREFQAEADVDTGTDLASCAAALAQLPQPTPAQVALHKWMASS
jgi:uncharacterized protein